MYYYIESIYKVLFVIKTYCFFDLGKKVIDTKFFLISDNSTIYGTIYTTQPMMAQMTGEEQTKWDENLAELMLALNSSTSESTAYSPAQFSTEENSGCLRRYSTRSPKVQE